MTCSKDCENCMYGIPKIVYVCGDRNTTCCSTCSMCPSATKYLLGYYCAGKVAYRGCTGTGY